jgi:hypothetical protein
MNISVTLTKKQAAEIARFEENSTPQVMMKTNEKNAPKVLFEGREESGIITPLKRRFFS